MGFCGFAHALENAKAKPHGNSHQANAFRLVRPWSVALELDAVVVLGRVLAVPVLAPCGGSDQALPLIVVERILRRPAQLRELADSHLRSSAGARQS